MSPELLGELLRQAPRTRDAVGVVVGRLCSITDEGIPMVEVPGRSGDGPDQARTTVALAAHHVGAQVVLVFEGDDLARPIVIGVLQSPALTASVTVDDRETVIEGHDRIELRCGKAKIVLTSDGKVLVKGTDIVSRSEGPNRVKGASVQIN